MRKYIFIFLLLVNQIIQSATYYMATDGNDEAAGAIGTPWATWTKIIATVSSGDTVYFRDGTYSITSTISMNNKDGSYGDPICYFNYPDESPIFDFSGMQPVDSYNNAFYLYNTDYVHFKGIEVKHVRQINPSVGARGFYLYNCSNITFTQVVVHEIGSIGIFCSESDSIYHYNCDVYNVADTLSVQPGNNGYGFYFYSNVTGNKYGYYQGCRAWHVTDQGFCTARNTNVVWDSCWSWNNGYLQYGAGMGWKFGFETVDTCIRTITNCIAAYNKYAGFNTNGVYAGYPMYWYNNTSYHNAAGYTIYSTTSSDEIELSRILRNNIAYQNSEYAVSTKTASNQYTDSHNSWNGEVAVTDADFISLDSTGLTGARQSNGSLPVINFLKLASTSDLIDAGTDVGLDYMGLAPDMGAWEYESPNPPDLGTVINVSQIPSVYTCKVSGNANDDGGGTVSDKGICWSTSENPTTSDNHYSAGAGTGAFSTTIKQLAKNTIYHVRSYITNEAGTAYSANETFTTKSEAAAVNNGVLILYNGKSVKVN